MQLAGVLEPLGSVESHVGADGLRHALTRFHPLMRISGGLFWSQCRLRVHNDVAGGTIQNEEEMCERRGANRVEYLGECEYQSYATIVPSRLGCL